MIQSLIINGIDFNARFDEAKYKVNTMISYRHQITKWMETPDPYPTIDIKLLDNYRPYRSDMTMAMKFMLMAMKFMLMVEKQQQEIDRKTRIHEMLTKYGIGHVFDQKTGDLIWN